MKGVCMCAIMEELRNESLAEGETRGMIKILAGMVKKKKYTIQEAAAEVNLSENDFIEEAKKVRPILILKKPCSFRKE